MVRLTSHHSEPFKLAHDPQTWICIFRLRFAFQRIGLVMRRDWLLRPVVIISTCLMTLMLSACSEPPTWQKLLSLKITEQYPEYKVQVTANGALLVERPGKSALPVEADLIGRFCQRGPKDCNYATDQMLLELGGE